MQYAGIDIGSRTIELVVLRENKIIDTKQTDSSFDPIAQAKKLLKFIPQVYYETAKASRDLFYLWETNQLPGDSVPQTLPVRFYKLTRGCLTSSKPYYTNYDTLAFVFSGKVDEVDVEVLSSDGRLVHTYQGKPQFGSKSGEGICIPLESFEPGSYVISLTLQTENEKSSLTRSFFVNWLDISVEVTQEGCKLEITGKIQKRWKGSNLSAIDVRITGPQLNLMLTVNEGESFKEIVEIPEIRRSNIEVVAVYRDHLRYQPSIRVETGGVSTDYCTAAQKLYNGYGIHKLEI